jgi:hypothetical protein
MFQALFKAGAALAIASPNLIRRVDMTSSQTSPQPLDISAQETQAIAQVAYYLHGFSMVMNHKTLINRWREGGTTPFAFTSRTRRFSMEPGSSPM